mmetsp:Transcript_16518/g.28881  ORF Transcript_16518/g.28881 Transcript_16518/m.28881 type:complete len:301 (+) Transcript_16518:65-967(+)|eukprot:CAMPEP_0197657566 /NCGR_PEP_ID=MMETSP1338-20131121/44704_1 /TAXON_ID=43686 ORGANISM="Pelagodinium beii, Strain RCC1491" /NCGR_SAMPLE_ID=MMETSP1338 /ASSEMBLY_ACC=CAM_ASM_000754 /LENGTH=300 /DNA_ID=CAMNT_0043233963 /DNA_START=64 /DNA_END=966 /DNA_ORIENTATION=-
MVLPLGSPHRPLEAGRLRAARWRAVGLRDRPPRRRLGDHGIVRFDETPAEHMASKETSVTLESESVSASVELSTSKTQGTVPQKQRGPVAAQRYPPKPNASKTTNFPLGGSPLRCLDEESTAVPVQSRTEPRSARSNRVQWTPAGGGSSSRRSSSLPIAERPVRQQTPWGSRPETSADSRAATAIAEAPPRAETPQLAMTPAKWPSRPSAERPSTERSAPKEVAPATLKTPIAKDKYRFGCRTPSTPQAKVDILRVRSPAAGIRVWVWRTSEKHRQMTPDIGPRSERAATPRLEQRRFSR